MRRKNKVAVFTRTGTFATLMTSLLLIAGRSDALLILNTSLLGGQNSEEIKVIPSGPEDGSVVVINRDLGTPIVFASRGDSKARETMTYYIFSNLTNDDPNSVNIIPPATGVVAAVLLVIAVLGFITSLSCPFKMYGIALYAPVTCLH